MSSDEEEGRIGFEVTQADEDNEFYGRRRRQTKEEMLYGVFAEDMEDEDGGRGRQRAAPSHRSATRTGPMLFVKSGGGGGGGSADDASAAMDIDSDDDDKAVNDEILRRETETETPHTQPPAPAAPPSAAPPPETVPKQPPKSTFNVSAPPPKPVSDPFTARQAATSDAGPAAPGLHKHGGASGSSSTSTPRYSSFGRKTASAVKGDKTYLEFNKYTKGIGLKLLQKMGWKEGEGIGPAGQGIARPIDAGGPRQRGLGLQEEGERTEQARQDMPTKADIESAKEQEFQEELRQWKVKPDKASRNRKPKYLYKTVEELAAEGLADAAPAPAPAAMKIVDMRGAEARVYSGFDELSRQAAAPGAMPASGPTSGIGCRDLVYNVQMYVDKATTDVQQISSKMRKEKQRREALTAEEGKMALRVRQEEGHMRRLTEILEVVEHCRRRSASTDAHLNLEEVTEVLAKLKRAYPKEYEVYGLARLAGALLLGVVKAEFASWDALSDPHKGTHVVATCRRVLGDDGAGLTDQGQETMSLYETLAWDHLVPHLRTAVMRWEASDPEPAVALLDVWDNLLPEWMVGSILEQTVMPKLRHAVDAWEPAAAATPMHSWLLPWLPLCGRDALAPLFAPIRFKLASALQSHGWHPRDTSAIAMVAPWVDVFTPKETSRFLAKSVTPKLLSVLRNDLTVQPAAQDIEPLKWVLAWTDVYPAAELGTVVDAQLARKWLGALALWLATDSPNFDEVLRWYRGWKKMLGPKLGATAPVQRLLARGADMINRAALVALGLPTPPRLRKRAHDMSRLHQGGPPTKRAKTDQRGDRQSGRTGQAGIASVRDLVNRLADERGVMFVPKGGRTTDDGSELYTLGKLTMYVKQGVVYARRSKAEGYEPVSIDDLMDMAV
eukprot:m.58522 g.58522  ORF g.58522 m.58522 type:complete len:896 (+) comp7829_c0_seq1:37-2724(+)